MAGSSQCRGSVDPLIKVLGTEATDIMPDLERHDPGTINRVRAPPGMHRSLPTIRIGHLESLLVGVCTARKAGGTSSGIRVNEVDCLGSATEAVVTGSMAETIFHSANKEAGL